MREQSLSAIAMRVFKTAWFSKAARKAHIADAELCKAIRQVVRGQADDLGGGVFKKRLSNNMHRSIILAKGGCCWVYAYLFSKKDRGNIEEDELVGFRALAKAYAGLTNEQIDRLLRDKEFMEICNDKQTKIQE
ncbi:type II toxin-antitoxin system RelE/ParE family toxin [Verminephrobacter aporrectodeae]|uniref:Type II toxin-antitoxin system RelE/ParE family toxin n=2 Tax=Verminephrobacter TaxID=364316 RepID=A0ABT3KRT9_9BURK|nr:type II toxin-antitoxin system RelE/ParE family toxin [Verminephrobacter aporrectodeae subsp. tuberculatae]MCW5320842.1 type II toxin-antitoxin system RelE/ParE family toxin [Verminephrobacter aporrectodeae subsp. tuberculatae]MCW8176084.1 type II toxin-antitoxin system RelE/ParE family toxin [Verminephrobacter aporrectodeae subsp. tuberculatae]MCW8199858.1 type II toxin-antitoxin system RelE/ParE family toxin [Verminephrobacter aporrectodeae subsp. tuberculatae]MCW8203104.1 type II toxin-an